MPDIDRMSKSEERRIDTQMLARLTTPTDIGIGIFKMLGLGDHIADAMICFAIGARLGIEHPAEAHVYLTDIEALDMGMTGAQSTKKVADRFARLLFLTEEKDH